QPPAGLGAGGRLSHRHHRAGRRGGVHGGRTRGGARRSHPAAGRGARIRRSGHRIRARRDRTRRRRRPRRYGGVGVSTSPEFNPSPWKTLKRGLALSPELRNGLAVTVLLALITTVGRGVVPV